jgi:superfamily I DNA/RNA helicase
VDEAQDLTPLQWTMVEKMSDNAEEIIIAGDDDQAIHRWTGVNVQRFINSSKNIKVLNKSYRLPRSVWALSERISRRIPNRIPKEFYSREEEGRVDWVWRVSDLPLDQGSWTIMARTNSFVNEHLLNKNT